MSPLESLLAVLTLLLSAAYGVEGGASPNQIFHPFTLQSCTSNGSELSDCDPVNLVFPGKTWQQVRDVLVANGWSTVGFGSRQYMQFGNDNLVPEAEQLFLADGPDGRYHIRLWQGPARITFAGVHHEQDDPRALTHRLDRDWEASEAFVAESLCPAARSCTLTGVSARQHEIQGSAGLWRGWANDARATVIVLR